MAKNEISILPSNKIADVIIKFPDILSVLERFSISLGFEDKKIRDITDQYHIDLNAFLSILKAYEYEAVKNSNLTLNRDSIPDILYFLKRSHDYLKNISIPALRDLIKNFSGDIPEKHGKMLVLFFDGYIEEIKDHFTYEEQTVFPYVGNIIEDKHPKKGKFEISRFEKTHSDIQQKLLDLKNILIKYIPENVKSEYRFKILRELINMQKDLEYHSFIENHILVPSVKEFEKTI